MRKLHRYLVVLPLLTAFAVSAGAAVYGDAGPRESLLTADSLSRISIGLDFLFMRRDVTFGETARKLEFQTFGGELGVDICPWLTVFGGAGSARGRFDKDPVWGDNDMSWLAGLRLDLWKYDLADPNFLSGQITFAAEGQYAQYSSKLAGQDMTGEEWFAAFTAGYEIFADRRQELNAIPYSVRLTLGPAVSTLKGEAFGQDYDAKDKAGFLAGCELFISHNLDAGVNYLYFGSGSFDLNLRLHF